MVHASSTSHRHILQLQAQAQCEERDTKRRKVQERETKRQKVRDEKEESGVGFSVEQLKNNRGLLASTLPREERTGSTNSVNSCHPEDNDHHATKVEKRISTLHP